MAGGKLRAPPQIRAVCFHRGREQPATGQPLAGLHPCTTVEFLRNQRQYDGLRQTLRRLGRRCDRQGGQDLLFPQQKHPQAFGQRHLDQPSRSRHPHRRGPCALDPRFHRRHQSLLRRVVARRPTFEHHRHLRFRWDGQSGGGRCDGHCRRMVAHLSSARLAIPRSPVVDPTAAARL